MLRWEIRVKLKLFPLFCSDNSLNDLFMVSMILAVPPKMMVKARFSQEASELLNLKQMGKEIIELSLVAHVMFSLQLFETYRPQLFKSWIALSSG